MSSRWDEFSKKWNAVHLKEMKPGESWIMMVYGPSKTGKTFFAGSAGARTLFLNIGDGLETLHAPAFRKLHGNVVDEMIVKDLRDSGSTAEAFDKTCAYIDDALEMIPELFDTIVLDEATAYRKYALNKAMELNKRSQGPVRSRLENYTKAEIDDYGVEMDMIQWFLGTYIPLFKERKKHFIMLAHERQIFNAAAKIGGEQTLKKVQPGFTGKTFPDSIPSYFDDVWHSEVAYAGVNAIYQLRTHGRGDLVGGSRHGGIFDLEERDPNFLTLLRKIHSTR